MIQLYSGVYFDPLNPDPALITIEDIAHALSLQCRYAGHCRYHYSVAQHCCLVHDVVDPHLRRWALLHDADEGLGLPDLPTLVKRDPRMTAYREAQAAIMRAVVERFGLDPAIAAGPILTTVTDTCGFFFALALASGLLHLRAP